MITPEQAIIKQIKLVGFWARYGVFDQSHEFLQRTFDEISKLFLNGTLVCNIEKIYRLEDFKQALKHAGSVGRHGKILFSITQD